MSALSSLAAPCNHLPAHLIPPLPPLPPSASLKAQEGLGVGLGWLCGAAGTTSLLTHQFQAEPCRCSR